MEIPVSQARAVFTQARVAEYRERIAPTAFLRSFFPSQEKGTKYLSIEVQRGTEKVAVQVVRGTEGNRNKLSKSTEKIFYPPYYHEFLDATELDLYDRLFTESGVISGTDVAAFVSELNDGMSMLQDKIERSYELQCAQVLETGIVQLKFGTNIDYNRKATSLVDLGAPNYWTVATVDPSAALEAGGKFLRTEGKMRGGMLTGIFGGEALAAMLDNPLFVARANMRRMDLLEIHPPQANAVGAVLHGQVTAGTFKVNVWSYPEVYDDELGVSTEYINTKKVILMPAVAPKFVFGFAAVPQLLTTGGTNNAKGAYVFNDYVDERKATHEFDIKSAGLAIPVAVDQMYTFQAVA